MLTSLTGAIVGLVVAAPFSYMAWRCGDNTKALAYLVLGLLAGFFLGRALLTPISNGVI
jgi:hypothetical protein